ncbi:hypothetical protein ANO14919_030630 [Xylariales sp. No.14919]|nr:hypothetical protein ANO14919_030630 [Xylariales sp. No.14919]
MVNNPLRMVARQSQVGGSSGYRDRRSFTALPSVVPKQQDFYIMLLPTLSIANPMFGPTSLDTYFGQA